MTCLELLAAIFGLLGVTSVVVSNENVTGSVPTPTPAPERLPIVVPSIVSDSKPCTFNAAAPSSLGSSDCAAEIPTALQTLGHFTESIYCGAPRGNGNRRPACGKTLHLYFNGRQTSCVIAWNAEDPNPRSDVAYVEIFAKTYTELTGNPVVNEILWHEGMFDGECSGDCR